MAYDEPGLRGCRSRLHQNLPHTWGGGEGEQPGPGGTRRSRRLQGRATPEEERTAWRRAVAEAGGPEAWRDWRGLPEDVLVKVAQIFVAQTEAKWAVQLKADGFGGTVVRNIMKWRKREGTSLFVFAMVCKGWRKAQLKINSLRAAQERPRPWPVAPSGPLRTRVESYVILPGRVALAKWALGEGCPREGVNIYRDTGAPGSHHVTMAQAAARFGHLELVRWLVEEQGFEIDDAVVDKAAGSGNLELVQWLWGDEGFEVDKRLMQRAAESGHLGLVKWLRGKGCDWNAWTCALAAQRGHLEVLEWLHTNGCPMSHITVSFAVQNGHVEVLRWARENGCPWHAVDRDRAAAELGYTDNLGNLFDPNDP